MPAHLAANCCYLLRSLASGFAATTYIGFTNDPARRVRQHNGEIKAGAKRTSRKRPWAVVAVVGGFPSKVAALQFEWAWQHPGDSRAVRRTVGCQARKRGAQHKLTLAHAMLRIAPWSAWPLTVHYVDTALMHAVETARPLPPHMRECRGVLAGASERGDCAHRCAQRVASCARARARACFRL